MTTRHRLTVRSGPAVSALVTLSVLLTACSTSNATPKPATAAPAAQPSVAATAQPSVAPTRVTASAAIARSLRSAPAAPCRAGDAGGDCIQAGTYLLDPTIPPGTVTLDVPAGWFEWDPGGGTEGLLVDSGKDAPDGSGWGILLSGVGTISRDPCHASRGSIPADQAGTVDDVAGAIAGWPGFRATAPPQSVRIDGVEGRMVELTYAGDPSKCAASRLWTTPSGMAIDAYPMIDASAARPAQLLVFKIGSQLLIIRSTDYPEPSSFEESQGVRNDPARHAADQLALRSIISSIRFGPAGG